MHDHRYSVWAPQPREVTLLVNGDRAPMQREAHGWWWADRVRTPGDRYGFLLDGEGPIPDPRSPFQPDGIHALSQHVGHEFPWTDQRWQAPPLASAVIYELHIGTFTPEGTFDAAIERLSHLSDLGVTHLELMPVNEFSGTRGWGYDGVDLFAPHHAYGGPEGLKRFVNACHERGLAVLLDVVYNHLGPAGNYLAKFGPYFTEKYNTPWGPAVNLDDAGSHEVRRFFCDNALMWLRDYHFDGLRLDAVHAFVDASATHLLEQLAGEVDTLRAVSGRHLVLIAESDLNDPRVVRSREAYGYGMDAQWSDDFHHALHSALTGERAGYYADFGRLADLARAIHEVFVYAGRLSEHRGRPHGRPPHELPGWRFVVAAQNHDQIGNRAQGDRLTHLVGPDGLKIAAALLLTSPFVPMLFQGEEWGASSPFQYFTSHDDPELGKAVSEGRRREFGSFGWKPEDVPDPQDPTTFERSKLRWDEAAGGPHAELLEWYRTLIRLRRDTPALRDGAYSACRVEYDEDARWITVHRADVIVACNLAQEPRDVTLGGPGTVLAASVHAAEVRSGSCRLPGGAVLIFRRDTQTA
jgi:maltooligosyltrehalose trehalohydrolase